MLQIIATGVYQYFVVRFINTLVTVLTQVYGRYCELSNNPAFAHIWVCDKLSYQFNLL